MTGAPLRVLEGGSAPLPGVWAALWERDRWRQSELPHGDLSVSGDSEHVVIFERFAQPWLKDAAKRWARARLLAGTSVGTVVVYVSHLAGFSEWLAAERREVSSPAALTREVLEDFMLSVRTGPLKPAVRRLRIASVRMLLEEQREDALAGVPRAVMIHAAEEPRVADWLPKGIEEEVFGQVVDAGNLAGCSVQQRTIILLWPTRGFGCRAWSRCRGMR